MNCQEPAKSLPSSSVLGISQARILQWVAISFSRGSSWPRDRTHVRFIGRQILYHWTTWGALLHWLQACKLLLEMRALREVNIVHNVITKLRFKHLSWTGEGKASLKKWIYTIDTIYIKYITNKNLLCNTENSTWCSVVPYMGRKSKREGIYIYIYSWLTLLYSRN